MLSDYILLFGYFGGLIALTKWAFSATRKQQEEEEMQRCRVDMDALDKVSEIKDNIKLLSDMITDVRSCDPDNLLRTVTVTVNEYNRSYNFLIDGSNIISDDFISLMIDERNQLEDALSAEVAKIQGPV